MTADAPCLVTSVAFMLAAAGSANAGTPAPIETYLQAVHAAIMQVWVQPASVRSDLQCAVDIEQRDGGEVVQASFGSDCNADAATREALERAIGKASPLPYAGFESVFQHRIHLVFKYSGH